MRGAISTFLPVSPSTFGKVCDVSVSRRIPVRVVDGEIHEESSGVPTRQ